MSKTNTGHHQSVDLLVKSGAHANVKSNEGHTAEQIAHLHGHHGIYEFLKGLRENNKEQPVSETESESEFTAVSNNNQGKC